MKSCFCQHLFAHGRACRRPRNTLLWVLSPNGEAIWDPLKYMIGSLNCEFMWMFESRWRIGRRSRAYKHVFTVLPHGSDGRSFEFETLGAKGPRGMSRFPS